MSGRQEVDCSGCGRRHVTSAEQARVQRVTRCECGQFVRLDRALAELRSEPAPAPAVEPPVYEADDDEETHMVSSLAAVAAMSGRARGRVSQASLHADERVSRPAPSGTLRSLSPVPGKYPSSPPSGEKPLWYVDLGGVETVEMTIEQLIVARRTGKLGEGALVWREGMPRWRPVGTLIAATSVDARSTPIPAAPSRPTLPPPAPSRSTLPPPAPTRPPMPSRVPEALPPSLASYERPLATLEFALEKSSVSEPAPAMRSPSSSPERSRASRPPRGLTPVPQPATWLASSPHAAPPSRTSTSVASRLPSIPPPPPPPAVVVAALRSPPPPAPAPRITPIPTPLPSFTSDRPAQPSEGALQLWFRARPRALSAGIALLVCITASGSGALLVRSLKLRHQPMATASALSPALPTPSAPRTLPPPAPVTAAEQPRVVDLQSLSVERPTHRNVRPVAAPIVKAPSSPSSIVNVDDSAESSDDSSASPSLATKLRNADLPSAAHANPYTTGSVEGSADKKSTTAGSDEPGL